MDTFRFPYLVEHGGDGWYLGSVPALPGCHTQGKTLDELRDKTMDELRDNLKEAVGLYLETMTEAEKAELRVDEFVGIHEVTILV